MKKRGSLRRKVRNHGEGDRQLQCRLLRMRKHPPISPPRCVAGTNPRNPRSVLRHLLLGSSNWSWVVQFASPKNHRHEGGCSISIQEVPLWSKQVPTWDLSIWKHRPTSAYPQMLSFQPHPKVQNWVKPRGPRIFELGWGVQPVVFVSDVFFFFFFPGVCFFGCIISQQPETCATTGHFPNGLKRRSALGLVHY